MTIKIHAAQVEMIPVRDLKPYADNARTHPESQIQALMKVIQDSGFTQPLLVDEDGEVIGGHGRILAAERLGMEELPCVRVVGLDANQKRALRISDNQIALLSTWDNAKLALDLGKLKEANFDLGLTGFSKLDLRKAMGGAAGGQTDPDEVPPLPEVPVSRPGDLWILGDHRLLCGDSCKAEDVDRLMDGELAHILFTDPPWNVNYGAAPHPTYKQRSILNDHMTPEKWAEFITGFCESFRRATKPGAMAYVVMSAQEWPTVDGAMRAANFHWSSTIIWAKDRMVLSRKDYHTRYEPIWYGWNKAASRLAPLKDRKQDDVWEIPRPAVSELHPTTKPVALIEKALANSSEEGAVVLDLFGGSGSTLIGAHVLGRRARLMELDPKYADVIVQRWQSFAGKPALLQDDGRDFATVAETRASEASVRDEGAEPQEAQVIDDAGGKSGRDRGGAPDDRLTRTPAHEEG